MYDHIGVTVNDLAASVRFYAAALAPLGHVVASHDAASAGIGPEGAPSLWLYQASSPPGTTTSAKSAKATPRPGAHIAFRADTHAAVEGFHRAGVEAGGRDHGKPGIREDYAPTYFAAFLLDPDGNNVEVVCTK